MENSERIEQPQSVWENLDIRIEAHDGIDNLVLRTFDSAYKQLLGKHVTEAILSGYKNKEFIYPDDEKEAMAFAAGFWVSYELLVRQTDEMINGRMSYEAKKTTLAELIYMIDSSEKSYEQTGDHEESPHEYLRGWGTVGFSLYEGLSGFVKKQEEKLTKLINIDDNDNVRNDVIPDENLRATFSLGFGVAAASVHRMRHLSSISTSFQQDQIDAEVRAFSLDLDQSLTDLLSANPDSNHET